MNNDVSQYQDRPTSLRQRTVGWLVLAAALAYLCRNAVGVAESTIREDLGLSLPQSGMIMSAFFWSYALLQVPSGLFAERAGTRRALAVFAIGWSMATFGVSIAYGFTMLALAQLFMGASQAGIFPAACNSVGRWMPMSNRSFACGCLAAGMQIGAITASWLTGKLLQEMDWRWVFIFYAIPGALYALAFYLQFRDSPDEDSRVNQAELKLIASDGNPEEARVTEAASFASILAMPALWLICGQQICRAAGYVFFATWYPTYLQETRGISVAASGFQQGLVLMGTLFGGIYGGWVVDSIYRRTGSLRLSRGGVGCIALAICGSLIVAAWFVQQATLASVLIALGAVFAAFAGPCAYASTIDIAGPRVPQVFGTMNMCGNLASASSPLVVGWIFARTDNWDLVLLLFAGLYLVGAACWLGVSPTRPPSEPDAR